uniref:Transmembrane protein n=1 Tax=Ascaris lumbricoides TaxID=6252 RepID=A0A0M3IHL4_ASCLU
MNKQIHGVPVKEYFTNLASKEVSVEEDNPSFRCVKSWIHVYPLTKALFLVNIGGWLLAVGIMFPWSILVFWIPLVYFLITIYALRQRNALCMWPAIIHSPLTKALFLVNIGGWLLAVGIMFPWSILVFWIPLVYFLITIYALRQRNALCMWPAIIHSVMLLLIWASATIVLFSTAIFSTQSFLDTFSQGHHEDFFVRLLVVLVIKIIMVLIGLFLIYQCHVFNLCRKYFDIVRNADVNPSLPEEATELQAISEKA